MYVYMLLILVVFQGCPKHCIPEFGGDAIACLKVLVVMSEVILFHLLKVKRDDFGMMKIVVSHVIQYVAEDSPSDDTMRHPGWEESMGQLDPGIRQYDK